MPRAKKARKEGHLQFEDIPLEACKYFLINCIAEFYERKTAVSLEQKYIRYGEECITKFKNEIWQMMMESLRVPEWQHKMERKEFNTFLKNHVHDALWNSKVLLTKHGRIYRANDTEFEDVIARADLFTQRCFPLVSRRNRIGSVGWWARRKVLRRWCSVA